jgi:hypothetical protein
MHDLQANRSSPFFSTLAAWCFLPIFFPASARAQTPLDEKPPVIQDNSFLIEEAYNQERGIIQEIQTFTRGRGGDWTYTLTQEWPVPDQKNQLSFTLPVAGVHLDDTVARGVGDLLLNYRYQLVGDGKAAVACAPRLSLVVPTGNEKRNLGIGGAGVQVLVPVSVVLSKRVVTHWNAGGTWISSAKNVNGDTADTFSYVLGQSFIWLAHPQINFLVETLYTGTQSVGDLGRRERETSFLVSPGLRWAFNFKRGLQIVQGIAVPIGVGPSRGDHSLFVYLSFEHPIPGLSE